MLVSEETWCMLVKYRFKGRVKMRHFYGAGLNGMDPFLVFLGEGLEKH